MVVRREGEEQQAASQTSQEGDNKEKGILVNVD